MPNRLKVHPNERLDVPDLEYGTSGYTDAKAAQLSNLLAGSKPVAVEGFRIEIPNQTTNPGSITVHNGSYVDTAGKLVTNEDSLTSAQTVSLTGTNQTFYLELVFVESEVALDDRGIWDDTFDNGVGQLKGKEFLEEVTTRVSTVWSVVSPISTTGFDYVSNPTSVKVPLAILKTDSVGRVTVSANTGLSTGPFATVLAEDAAASSATIKVLDASLLLDGPGQLTIGTETKTVNSIDHATGVVSLTTGLTSFKAAGTIVSNVGGPSYVKQRTSEVINFTGGTSVHPDKLRRLFAGDELRGIPLMASKDVTGGRDDTQLVSFKDHIDFIAAQLKEMKVGTNPSLPSDFSTTRYYDNVGSLQSVKSVTYTIGDGVLTIGDFNGTTEVPFQSAHDAAVARGFSGVNLVVKQGLYVFGTSTITTSIPTYIKAETPASVFYSSANTGSMFHPLSTFELDGGNLYRTVSSLSGAILTTTSYDLNINIKNVTATLSTPLVQVTGTSIVSIEDSNIFSSSTYSLIWGTGISLSCVRSVVRLTGSAAHMFDTTGATTVVMDHNTVTHSGNGSILNLSTGSNSNSLVQNNVFSFTGVQSTASVIRTVSAATVDHLDMTYNAVEYTDAGDSAICFNIGTNASYCNIGNNTVSFVPSTSGYTGAGVCALRLAAAVSSCIVSNNNFKDHLLSTSLSILINITNSTLTDVKIVNNKVHGGQSAINGGPCSILTSFDVSNNIISSIGDRAIIFSSSTALDHVTISNNIFDNLYGGGIDLVAGGGRNVVINNNSLIQAGVSGPVSFAAINISGATNVTVNGNTIQGDPTATTGASTSRTSLSFYNCNNIAFNGNSLFWNTQNSGTANQPTIFWQNCNYGIGTGNTGLGSDGGSNIWMRGDYTGSGTPGVVGYMANMIKGSSVATQFVGSGGASPAAPSLASGANIFIV